MLKGFKDFIMKGNVVDLAVAVVIGAAFSGVVEAFTKNFIQPLINIFGGSNAGGLAFQIVSGNEATKVDVSAIIAAAINFVVVAAVVYFLVVVPMKKLQDLSARGKAADEAAAAPTDVELLAEIRDLLKSRSTQV